MQYHTINLHLYSSLYHLKHAGTQSVSELGSEATEVIELSLAHLKHYLRKDHRFFTLASLLAINSEFHHLALMMN